MATTSIFADIARLRFPNLERVIGAGPFAVVSRCSPRPIVRLFETRTEAYVVAHQPCGPECKRTAHDWLELRQPPPRFIRKPSWSKLIADD